jgi:YidC/Oxa1 family membrane protein insertase
MDRKSIIILVISFVLLVSWFPIMNKVYPPKPLPTATNALATVTNQFERGATPPAPANATSPPAPRVAAFSTPAGAKEEVQVLTNENARYTFTSYGGGLKLVELTKYPETVGCHSKVKEYKLASLNTPVAPAVLAWSGGEASAGDGVFALSANSGVVRAEKQLPNGLYLTKEFRLGSNYLLQATARLENRSAQPIALPSQAWNVGTATPMGPLDNEQFVGLFWHDGSRDSHLEKGWFDNKSVFSCIGLGSSTPRTAYTSGPTKIVWAAVQNQFFTLALMPATPALDLTASTIDLPPPSPEVLAENPRAMPKPVGIQVSLVYGPTNLAPNQVLETQFNIYAGPKQNRTLEIIDAQLHNNIHNVMDYGGFFGWFAQALLWAMNGLYLLVPSYAFAIIAITVILKLLFWPLTQAQTRSMKRMQELQPQIKALQEKYKDDPAKQQRKMMEFWKENKINPLGGCLPMLLQLPIFFGFFKMVRTAIELRGARFLWACDLSKSDTLFLIPGLNFPFNPLPLLMGATMLWQARLSPASPGMDPVQQKIMKYMPLMFLFILYDYSAGLTLYWTVQNLLTIAQMKLIRAKETAAVKTPVTAPAPRRKH